MVARAGALGEFGPSGARVTDTFDYVGSQATATRLLTKFGTTVAFGRMVNSGSELEPTQTPLVPAPTSTGARLEFTMRHYQRWTIQMTDQRWLVAAAALDGFVPVPGDTLNQVIKNADGIVTETSPLGTVMRADPINPAGTPVVYDVQVRA